MLEYIPEMKEHCESCNWKQHGVKQVQQETITAKYQRKKLLLLLHFFYFNFLLFFLFFPLSPLLFPQTKCSDIEKSPVLHLGGGAPGIPTFPSFPPALPPHRPLWLSSPHLSHFGEVDPREEISQSSRSKEEKKKNPLLPKGAALD